MAKPLKKPMTVAEFAALGGKARAKLLTKKRRTEIAQTGAAARWKDKPVRAKAAAASAKVRAKKAAAKAKKKG